MERDKDGKEFVTLVSTPGGYFTPSIRPPVAGKATDLDEAVDNLLKAVDIPLSAMRIRMPDGRRGIAEYPPANPLCHRVRWDDGTEGSITPGQFQDAVKTPITPK